MDVLSSTSGDRPVPCEGLSPPLQGITDMKLTWQETGFFFTTASLRCRLVCKSLRLDSAEQKSPCDLLSVHSVLNVARERVPG